jgi:hypothetical protein
MAESVFRNLDLGGARNEGETYEAYKHRQKCNKHILKMYKRHGSEVISTAFPQGITYDDIYQSKQEITVEPQEAYIPTPNIETNESSS